VSDGTIFKYTDKNGRVVYTDVRPNPADVQVAGFTGNTMGRAQTLPPAGASSSEQSEAIKKQNAEARALTKKVNDAGAVYHEKLTAYGAAANKLNASRDHLFSSLTASNSALEGLDKTQDTSGYVLAALGAVGTGILVVATAPVTIVVGGVLVVGTAVVGQLNDSSRPKNQTASDHPEADAVKAGSKVVLRAGEVYEGAHHAHKALELARAGGTSLAPLGAKIPVAGALVTGLTAHVTAVGTSANQIGTGINNLAGLESVQGQLRNFDPSFLERNWAGFDKEKLLDQFEDTIEAQKGFDEAERELNEASAAYQAAFRAWNDTYVARPGGG